MTIRSSIYRFLSIGLALVRLHFHPPPSVVLQVRDKSCVRIGKYDTKSTSTAHGCFNGLPCIAFLWTLREVDFISIFIDPSAPRLKLISTIHRKIRYEMGVPRPKYRFLSIGMALLQSHFPSFARNVATNCSNLPFRVRST